MEFSDSEVDAHVLMLGLVFRDDRTLIVSWQSPVLELWGTAADRERVFRLLHELSEAVAIVIDQGDRACLN